MAGTQGLECYRPQTREEIQSPHSASFPFVRVRQVPDRAPVNRAAQRLGRAASIPRAKTTELLAGALGKGSRRHGVCRRRYHCPCPGYPFNRSRRCTRSRVPPSASLCSRSCGCHFAVEAMRPWRTPDRGLRPQAHQGRVRLRTEQKAGCVADFAFFHSCERGRAPPSSRKPTHAASRSHAVAPSRKRLRVRVPPGFAVTG